ncbi:MAG TPA: polysaccharide deacetylase family protein [Firmicutes bacterium]|uniref:Polysaccharide deacetylase family protein n=1 Tax=Capillibacterium thermochitinicola TaxID=2699427 RepID=A0A8J6I358_9FIRM|nr:polysaccharide deacetylase family protein [Capillibacterium thermochitinicola]MBA2133402.1 polysaccharide deacetylase family protein [Capillibacterium thermochitinicola]HHW13059.1 polysaccharide deacetylase family protein [Bacillota bacterium]
MINRFRSPLSIALALFFLAGVSLPAAASRTYQVQPGDTVFQIARWHGASPESIASHNQLNRAGYIIPGQVLFIPEPATLADEKLYTVQNNESLFTIAQKFQTNLSWLRQRNWLSADQIYTGQWLKVPAVTQPATGGNGNAYVWNIPALMARHPGKVFLQGATQRKQVALTFDDGPDLEYTPQILDLLAQFGVKATFFLKGANIAGREWVVTRMVREGHLVANHSYSHPDFRKLTTVQIVAEVTKTEGLVKRITGRETALLRPPYGEMTAEGLDRLVTAGYTMVNWSVDSKDWRADHQADQILANIMSQVKPGAIILMHSAGGSGQDLTPTVKALPALITNLQAMGYEIVPLTDLLPVAAYKPGV